MPATPQHDTTTVRARITAVLGIVTLFAGAGVVATDGAEVPDVHVASAAATQPASLPTEVNAPTPWVGELVDHLRQRMTEARQLRDARVDEAISQALEQLAQQRAREQRREAREQAAAEEAARQQARQESSGSGSGGAGSSSGSGSATGSSTGSSTGGGASSSGSSSSGGSTDSSGSSSSSTSTCDHECRGQRIAALLSVSLPSGWAMEFEPSHPTFAGTADSGRRMITLYVSDRFRDETLLWVLYHEAGHAYDFASMNATDRQRWADARGYDADPWFPPPGELDYDYPAGDWAESFAHCRSGLTGHYRSELAGPPSSAQCDLMRDLAG